MFKQGHFYKHIFIPSTEQTVAKSSVSNVTYDVAWLSQSSNAEHPWIDIEEISNRGPGKYL